MPKTCWLLAAAGLLVPAIALPAAQSPLVGDSSQQAVAEEVARWIQQLDGAEFGDRQEASQKLSESGAAAFPILEKSIQSGSREASGRALDILKRHFQGGDDETKRAAREVLERLAQINHASTAQRARDVLVPPKDPVNPQPIGGGFPNAQFRPANVQIQMGGNFGVARRTSIREANGRREVEVEENNRKIKMQTLPNGRIELEITDRQNGRDVTKKFEAKDLEDLKRQDADAARTYEQHSQPPRIQLGAVPQGAFPGRAFGVVPMPVVPTQPPDRSLQRALESIDASIERYKGRLPSDPSAQRMIDSLKQTRQRYQELLPAEARTLPSGR